MKNREIKVLVLDGCSYCEELKEELEAIGLQPMYLDANKETQLADYVEAILDTLNYPIIKIEQPVDTYFLFRPNKLKQVGKVSIGLNNYKIGCLSINDMVKNVVDLLK